MRTSHYISLAAAASLIALLYWGVNTVPPAKSVANHPSRGTVLPVNGMPGTPAGLAPASLDSINTASKKGLPAHASQELAALETRISAIHDSGSMIPVFEEMAVIWKEHKQFPMYAYTRARAAHLAHSEKNLNFAGQFFLDLMHRDSTPSVQLWEAQQAINCFNEALDLNPENDTTKLSLASGYIEGTGETMKGVQILRGITARKPDDIPANLMLGRLSIQSGQYDKAVQRYETVLKQDPVNREALYFLAEAWKRKGDKEKAIALFEQCKRVINDPAFSREIDDYINSFK